MHLKEDMFAIGTREDPDLYTQDDAENSEWGPLETAYLWTAEGCETMGITPEYLEGRKEFLVPVTVETFRTITKAPPMTDKYYVNLDRLTRGDRDMSKIVEVPKEVFDKLLPHADDFGRGSSGHILEDFKLFDLKDADLRPSEIDAIPDDHFIYVALC